MTLLDYRFYLIGETGHIRGVEILYCAQSALPENCARILEKSPHLTGVEVWHRAERLGLLPRNGPAHIFKEPASLVVLNCV